MFGIGMTELMVILVVALIVFGPTRLPELARSLGRAMGEFRRASTDLRQTFSDAVQEPKSPTTPPQPAPAIAAPELQAGTDVATTTETAALPDREPSGPAT